jgi:hypothetical protein
MCYIPEIEESIRRLDFVGAMLLAWNSEAVEIDDEIIDGWWYMIECIKKDLQKASHRTQMATSATTTTA